MGLSCRYSIHGGTQKSSGGRRGREWIGGQWDIYYPRVETDWGWSILHSQSTPNWKHHWLCVSKTLGLGHSAGLGSPYPNQEWDCDQEAKSPAPLASLEANGAGRRITCPMWLTTANGGITSCWFSRQWLHCTRISNIASVLSNDVKASQDSGSLHIPIDLIVQDIIKEWALHHAIPTESVTTIPIAQTTHTTEVPLHWLLCYVSAEILVQHCHNTCTRTTDDRLASWHLIDRYDNYQLSSKPVVNCLHSFRANKTQDILDIFLVIVWPHFQQMSVTFIWCVVQGCFLFWSEIWMLGTLALIVFNQCTQGLQLSNFCLGSWL